MPITKAAANEPSICPNTNRVAPSTPGITSGKVTVSAVRSLEAPMTRADSSSAGSIDFIEAEIMTKATVPSNSAMIQAMPNIE